MNNNKQFEDCYQEIDKELEHFRRKWTLTSISWFDFEDVKQHVKRHVYLKWDRWEQTKPLRPWLKTTIQNQIQNIVRDNYQIYSRPCLKCEEAVEQDGCKLFGKQCDLCTPYKRWQKHKLYGNNINLAVQYQSDEKEDLRHNIRQITQDNVDYDYSIKVILREQSERMPEELFYLFQGTMITNNVKPQSRQSDIVKNNTDFLYQTVKNIIEEYELVQNIRINTNKNEEKNKKK